VSFNSFIENTLRPFKISNNLVIYTSLNLKILIWTMKCIKMNENCERFFLRFLIFLFSKIIIVKIDNHIFLFYLYSKNEE
jgi:NADH:ubiquinone oxidoreductase subunit 5 (subunit L)/multisubunit Na+/H+ antiporter MnhA subunit